MSELPPLNLSSTYARLRNDASVEALPVDATFWPRLMAGELGTFHNEFLVTSHTYSEDWSIWEMHPKGDEIVCLLSGQASFVLEGEGDNQSIKLSEVGAFLIVPKGTWHTAKIKSQTQLLFISAGEGTEHREITD